MSAIGVTDYVLGSCSDSVISLSMAGLPVPFCFFWNLHLYREDLHTNRVGTVGKTRLIEGRYVFIYFFQIGKATSMLYHNPHPRYLLVTVQGSEVSFKL